MGVNVSCGRTAASKENNRSGDKSRNGIKLHYNNSENMAGLSGKSLKKTEHDCVSNNSETLTNSESVEVIISSSVEEAIAIGLLNPAGKNNCFLNCTIQVLWHLDGFRKNFNLLHGHACSENSCIFCALKVIFTQFQFSEQSAIPPDALRSAMASAFADEHRFQLGYMEDAAECYEQILSRIHNNLNPSESSEDQCTALHCITHSKFSMQIKEKTIYTCKCHLPPEVISFNQFVHYVSTSALVKVSQESKNQTSSKYFKAEKTASTMNDITFGKLLKNATDADGSRECPSACCHEKVQTQHIITNSPEVISIGLVWDSSESRSTHISDLVHTIEQQINLSHLFDSNENGHKGISDEFQLVALVCYYGRHYSVILYEEQFQMWICCDDSTISEIGPKLASVVEKCCKGHYQPLLLLYANRSSSPIITTKALKNVFSVTHQPHLKPENCARLSSARQRPVSTRGRNKDIAPSDGSGAGKSHSWYHSSVGHKEHRMQQPEAASFNIGGQCKKEEAPRQLHFLHACHVLPLFK